MQDNDHDDRFDDHFDDDEFGNDGFDRQTEGFFA
jgi:hypothetical protein